MKLFIAICILFTIASADWTAPSKDVIMKNRQDCLKSENVPVAVIDKLNKRQYDDNLGQEARCYIRCLGIRGEYWDDEKGYDIERSYQIIESLGLNVSMDNLKKCIRPNTDNDDKCTWAAKDVKCLWTNKYISKKE